MPSVVPEFRVCTFHIFGMGPVTWQASYKLVWGTKTKLRNLYVVIWILTYIGSMFFSFLVRVNVVLFMLSLC